MDRINTWDDWEEAKKADPETEAEAALIAACRAGHSCKLGDTRPTEATDATRIRAPLLAYLIRGGCEACPTTERGIWLEGASVTGPLDITGATAKGSTVLQRCTFDAPIWADDAHLAMLSLGGSTVPGLLLERAKITGGVFLRDGFHATGEVWLAGATIGGQLSCSGGRFDNAEGYALNAQGAKITDQVFLSDGFYATGEVRLLGATIGGQLSCSGGRFDNAEECALRAQRLTVKEGLYFREGTQVAGIIDLDAAHVGDLVDDLDCWPGGADQLILDGFTYDRLAGAAPTDAARRLPWLECGSVWEGAFRPQPYQQLAKVLREMGHRADSTAVLISAQRVAHNLRQKERAEMREFARLFWRLVTTRASADADTLNAYASGLSTTLHGFELEKWHKRSRNTWAGRQDQGPKAPALDEYTMELAERGFANNLRARERRLRLASTRAAAWNWISDTTVRYGYKPERSLIVLGGIWIFAAFLAHFAWVEGSMAPNAAPILVSEEWRAFAEDAEVANPAAEWSKEGEAGQDYETFNRYAYAADVVVPILDFGQTEAWAPSTTRGPWGWHLWWARWVLSALGWIVTGLGAAALTGIIRRD